MFDKTAEYFGAIDSTWFIHCMYASRNQWVNLSPYLCSIYKSQ